MHAFNWIRNARRITERIELVFALRAARIRNKQEFQKLIDRWAREADIEMRWED